MLPAVVVKLISLVSSSVAELSTSVAVICPPAVTVILPSAVSTSTKSIAFVSVYCISPEIVELASRFVASFVPEVNVIAPGASANNVVAIILPPV